MLSLQYYPRIQNKHNPSLVTSMCKQQGIAYYINKKRLKASEDWKSSHIFANKILDKLIWDGTKTEQVNNKTLRAVIDELFDLATSKIYFKQSIRFSIHFKILSKMLGPDVTPIHVNDRHNNESFKAIRKVCYSMSATLYVVRAIHELDQNRQLFIFRGPTNSTDVTKIQVNNAPLRSMNYVVEFEYYQITKVSSDYADTDQYWLLISNKQAKINCTKVHFFTQFYYKTKDFQADYLKYYVIGCCLRIAAVQILRDINTLMDCFVLATKDMIIKYQDSTEILRTSKLQQQIKNGFCFLICPSFLVSPTYFKKTKHIEVLLMVMTLCLMVYAAILHQIHYELKRKN